jgi:hypothetical protein
VLGNFLRYYEFLACASYRIHPSVCTGLAWPACPFNVYAAHPRHSIDIIITIIVLGVLLSSTAALAANAINRVVLSGVVPVCFFLGHLVKRNTCFDTRFYIASRIYVFIEIEREENNEKDLVGLTVFENISERV